MSSSTPSSSPAVLDRLFDTVTMAYSQSLDCPTADVADDPLLQWCLDEIRDTHDPDNPDPTAAYLGAIGAMENAIRDLQAIVDVLEDQLEIES